MPNTDTDHAANATPTMHRDPADTAAATRAAHPGQPPDGQPPDGQDRALKRAADRPPSALGALTRRALATCRREPSLAVGPVLMSAFFLVIYHGQLGGAAALLVPGADYVAFLLPLVLLTTAFSGGAIAGQLLLRDIDSGYHTRLALTPARRRDLVAAPTLAGMVVVAGQTLVLILLGLLLGMARPTGVGGLVALSVLTVAAAGGFLLLAVAAALLGRTMAAVNLVTYLFFPLSFLTPMLVPREALTGWMGVAADINPLSLLLEAMRATLTTGMSPADLGRGSLAVAILLALGGVATSLAVRRDAMEVDR